MKSKKIIHSAITAALAMGVVSLSTQAFAAKNDNMEKCYGIAKVGKNDCGNSSHSCSNQTKKDGDSNDYVMVPKGACEKIVGGKAKS